MRLFPAPQVCTVVFGFLLVVCFKWSPQTEGYLRALALPVWAVLLLYIGECFGMWTRLVPVPHASPFMGTVEGFDRRQETPTFVASGAESGLLTEVSRVDR